MWDGGSTRLDRMSSAVMWVPYAFALAALSCTMLPPAEDAAFHSGRSVNGIAIAAIVDCTCNSIYLAECLESAQNTSSSLQQDLCLSLHLEAERQQVLPGIMWSFKYPPHLTLMFLHTV